LHENEIYRKIEVVHENTLNPDQLSQIQSILEANMTKDTWVNEGNQCIFYEAEKFGFHILPVHFYSPLPDTKTLSEFT